VKGRNLLIFLASVGILHLWIALASRKEDGGITFRSSRGKITTELMPFKLFSIKS
jgi:hypothetical protein